jgi:hypothetical protein
MEMKDIRMGGDERQKLEIAKGARQAQNAFQATDLLA